ncbi:MAG: hypothetical protein JST06_04090 [Bacteroidetes bacterium]|nr:hypothetical protein [Bacteroidota bacterium]MBS1628913.1 hypothetical protein [Bacteroidota bacterium]
MNSTLWIALAIVGILATIIYLLKLVTHRQTKARKNAMWTHFRSLIAEHKIAPETVEEFRHRIFGLDTGKMHFLFVQHDPAQPYEVLNLSDQKDCRVVNSGVQVNISGKGGQSHTEEHVNAISLSFTSRSGVRINVPVYTEIIDGIEHRKQLQQQANNWQRRIHQVLSGIREAA